MTGAEMTDPEPEELAERAAPLDGLLVEAALGPRRRLAADASTVRFAARLARRPVAAGRRLGGLAAELARVGAGTSRIAPSKRDRGFADPAWTANPLLRRLVQAHLAAGQTAELVVEDAALGWGDDQRVRFLVENLVQALSPSTLPLVNPASAKAAIDTAGGSLAPGSLSFLGDLATPPRVPEMVDTSVFAVGRTVAVTPGAVVLRTEVLELIQYRPQTRAGPQGPTAAGAADDQQVLRPRPGIWAEPDRVPGAGRPAGVRDLLAQPGRPACRDLVWSCWVNNYLLGQKPPAFDILFWNADTTRMPAQLHADFVDLAMDNHLVTPGAMTVLGQPIDLSRIEVDAYVVAGIADHLTPWRTATTAPSGSAGSAGSCCRPAATSPRWSTRRGPEGQLPDQQGQPGRCAAVAAHGAIEQGSWWPDALAWLGERCGADKAAPRKLGGGGMRRLMDAPGTYVFDR